MQMLSLIFPNLSMYSTGKAPLHNAAVNGRTETALILLQEGADPNIQSNSGM